MMPRCYEVTEEEHEPRSIFRKLMEYKARMRRKVISRRKTVFKGPEAKEGLERPGNFETLTGPSSVDCEILTG